MSKPLKVFVTYSHKDTLAKDKLITLLAGLESENLIDIWHDNKITVWGHDGVILFSTILRTQIFCSTLFLVPVLILKSARRN